MNFSLYQLMKDQCNFYQNFKVKNGTNTEEQVKVHIKFNDHTPLEKEKDKKWQ